MTGGHVGSLVVAWGELDVDVSLRRSTVTLLEGPKDNTATGEETGGGGEYAQPNADSCCFQVCHSNLSANQGGSHIRKIK